MKSQSIFLVILFSSCVYLYNSPVTSEISERIKIIPKLKLREALLKDKVLSVVFIDSTNHYNPITASQKIEYGLSILKERKEIEFDYAGIIFKMPNRQGGDVDFGALKHDDLMKAISIFQDTLTSRIIDTLMSESYPSDGLLLEGINEFFAQRLYGSQMTKKAFFGVDAFYIIYGCVKEMQANQKGDNTYLVMSLVQNSSWKDQKIKQATVNIFQPLIAKGWL